MSEARYFVDERSGSIAVRDRNCTDLDEQGLHPEAAGVVRFWLGIYNPGKCPHCNQKIHDGWLVSADVRRNANRLCDRLNVWTSEMTLDRESMMRGLLNLSDNRNLDKEQQRQLCLDMNAATYGLEMHPDWWCNSCCCDTCLSYGDE